jgi:hypothetical protein
LGDQGRLAARTDRRGIGHDVARSVWFDERVVLAAVQGGVVAGDAALLEARQAVLWVKETGVKIGLEIFIILDYEPQIVLTSFGLS